MKKRLILLVFILSTYNTFAQDVVNGNFLINCGTTIPACNTFTDACIKNVHRSHGSAKFTPGGPTITLSYPNKTAHKGQGIFLGYNFCPGSMYRITVNTANCGSEGNLGSQTKMNVYVCNGLTGISSTTFDCFDFNPVVTDKIYVGDAETHPLSLFFYNTTSTVYSQLWIYMEGDKAAGPEIDPATISCDITSIHVERLVCSNYIIGENPTPSTYQGFGDIDVDSHYGLSGSVNIVGTTVFDVGHSAELNQNFSCVPTQDDYFLVELAECSSAKRCDDFVPAVAKAKINDDVTITGNDMDNIQSAILGNSVQNGKGVIFYPDPTTGIVNLSYYCNNSGDVNITVKNMTGIIVKTQNTYCNQSTQINQQIDLSSQPSGIYVVEVTLGNQHTIKKITKL